LLRGRNIIGAPVPTCPIYSYLDIRQEAKVMRIDTESLRLSRQSRQNQASKPTRLPRHAQGERFLRGPIPWLWLAAAARLPGKALHVAVQLWHWAGIKRTAEISLSMVDMYRQLGVNRHSGARGLKVLEKARLVSVVRHRGRHPIVTILASSPAPLSISMTQGCLDLPATASVSETN
jgi:hypothetical protein